MHILGDGMGPSSDRAKATGKDQGIATGLEMVVATGEVPVTAMFAVDLSLEKDVTRKHGHKARALRVDYLIYAKYRRPRRLLTNDWMGTF